jgi:hypothetical protein
VRKLSQVFALESQGIAFPDIELFRVRLRGLPQAIRCRPLGSFRLRLRAALVIGASWSLFGRATLGRLLRRSQVSLFDDLPSAWVALFRAKAYATQLSVKLKDGSRRQR